MTPGSPRAESIAERGKFKRVSRRLGPIIESNRLVAECQRRGILSERLFGTKEVVIDGARCGLNDTARRTMALAL